MQLATAATHSGRASRFQLYHMATGRNSDRFIMNFTDQLVQWHQFLKRRRRVGFQTRQGEQVANQATHAFSLIGCGLQILGYLCRRSIGQRILCGFNKAQRNGERCLELMRHIGDKVAAHGRKSVQLSDISHQ